MVSAFVPFCPPTYYWLKVLSNAQAAYLNWLDNVDYIYLHLLVFSKAPIRICLSR